MNILLLGIAAWGGWYALRPKTSYLGPSGDPNWKIGKVGLK